MFDTVEKIKEIAFSNLSRTLLNRAKFFILLSFIIMILSPYMTKSGQEYSENLLVEYINVRSFNLLGSLILILSSSYFLIAGKINDEINGYIKNLFMSAEIFFIFGSTMVGMLIGVGLAQLILDIWGPGIFYLLESIKILLIVNIYILILQYIASGKNNLNIPPQVI